MSPNPRETTADLVIFTEKILNGKLHFLCSVEHKIEYDYSLTKKRICIQRFKLNEVLNEVQHLKMWEIR